MNEQQRVFLAISLCLAILIGWQYLFVPPAVAPIKVSELNQPIESTKKIKNKSNVLKNEKLSEDRAEQPSSEKKIIKEESVVPIQTKEIKTNVFSVAFNNALDDAQADSGTTLLGLNNLELLKYKESSEDLELRSYVNLVDKSDNNTSRQALIKWHLGEYSAPRMAEEESSDGILFRGKSAKGLSTEVLIIPDQESYGLRYKLRVKNRSLVTLPVDATLILALNQTESEENSSFMAASSMQQMNARCMVNDEIEQREISELQEKDDEGKTGWRSPSGKKLYWAGIDRQYFVIAAAPAKPELAHCSMQSNTNRLQVNIHFGQELVAPEGEWNTEFTLYAGPKKVERLEEVANKLGLFVDYSIMGLPLGFIARPMIYLLNIFHGWTTSWGIAIILLTFFVKSILLPVTIKSTVSMRKMQLLRPELDKLKARFGNDRERMNVEQMKLFKEKGVNPLGGCLPMLLQMPVWFALYRSLWSAVDIYQQSFAWIPDLTAKEPFPFMAIAIGGLTVLQQKLTPTSVDNAQARMMMIIMPIMLMVFMIALPSGLVLYILVNSVLTLFQQLIINNMKIKI